jgi:hypothetical protein
MQNEPNLHRTAKKKMRNKANFTPKASTKQANGADYTHNKVSVSHQLLHSFAHFLAKSAHFSSLFPTFMQNELNSMYNKDLHKYFTPKYPSREEFTRRSCGGKICKTNPISKRSPVPPQADSSTHSPIYQFTKICKTNPISKPPPICPSRPTGHKRRAPVPTAFGGLMAGRGSLVCYNGSLDKDLRYDCFMG